MSYDNLTDWRDEDSYILKDEYDFELAMEAQAVEDWHTTSMMTATDWAAWLGRSVGGSISSGAWLVAA